ncbi:MAG: hemolysin III family protein, partial [Gammaproteobacteria bacterium]|nr:hemolysin III family protein [Gammaproteobacteria bacterium]
MPKDFEIYSRTQSLGEEIANSISHGIGLMAAIAALPILMVAAAKQGDTAAIIGASVFGATMILLYLSSTLYHALPASKAKRLFQVLDHAAIFL